jgi:hypothetical protein
VANGRRDQHLPRDRGLVEQRALTKPPGLHTVLRVVEVAQREKVTTAEAATGWRSVWRREGAAEVRRQ